MAETPIRYGILGCASIARRISRAITLSPNSILHAISSRSIDKAKKFASENSLPSSVKIYVSYDEVVDDPDVDAVYVPLPTTMHMRWAVTAAEKKKHVLLEKPVALNLGEVDRIMEACEENGVQFMDGTMWMHHPRTARMKEFLEDAERFGQLRLIHSLLTFTASPDFLKDDIRVKPDLDALGSLGDLGWYCIRASLWAVDYELPKTVEASRGTVFNDSGVILSCGASLHWDDGKVATFHCSYLSYLSFDVTVLGTKGSLRLSDFVVPFQEKYGTFYEASEFNFMQSGARWAPTPSEQSVITELPQESVMISTFSSLVGGIKYDGLKPERMWAIISRKTQLVLDAVKMSIEKDFKPVEL